MKRACLSWTVSVVCVTFCAVLLDASDARNSRDVCQRDSPDTSASKTPGDNGFRIKFAGRPPPERYTAGQVYTVGISGTYSNQKLLGFMLVAVPENAKDETTTMGTFQHMNNGLTKFGTNCPHLVMHTYTHPRNEVEVLWTAPATGAGCIEFRATVIQYKDIWYKDDGALTRVFCEDVGVSENDQVLAMIPDCCACGVGKYEMIFEGIWSRQTHPKDFPFHKRLLHWSNVVGASHSRDYTIWQYGGYATKGVRETCEYGYPRTLEQEIRKHSESVRTVIKTPGIWWVDPVGLQQTRTARFSVDRKFHLFSVIAMIGPSPDWCVGVSALNLCLPNCTWTGDMDIDMIPWDAGTDDGISFLSRNKKSEPQQKIHRITNTFPSNPASPFFAQEPIKRLGVVRLRRIHPEAGSSTVCDDEKEFKAGEDFVGASEVEDPDSEGGGKKKGKSGGEKQKAKSGGEEETEELTEDQLEALLLGPKDRPECITTEWSQWSVCSVSCGFGQRFRKRKYSDLTVNISLCDLALLESETCSGREQHCEKPDDPCSVTQWSDWSPCTVTCGRGIRERRRLYMKKEDVATCNRVLKQRDLCVTNISCSEARHAKNFTAICTLEKAIGPCRGSFQRWYYDHTKHQCLAFLYGGCRGNNNRFRTQSECIDMCEQRMRPARHRHGSKKKRPKKTHRKKKGGSKKKHVAPPVSSDQSDRPGQRPVSCRVSAWSNWSECSAMCGKSFKYKRRTVTRHPLHGGKKCPRKLERRARCKLPRCKKTDCKLGPWQAWTPCAKTCGHDSIQERTRLVIREQRPGGAACGPRIERRYCMLPDCPTGGTKGTGSEERPSELTARTVYLL